MTPIVLLKTPNFYLSIFLCVGFIFLTDYIMTVMTSLFYRNKIDVLRQLMKDNQLINDLMK